MSRFSTGFVPLELRLADALVEAEARTYGLAGIVVLGVLYGAITFLQVWHASGRDEARSVDAIVVLGAAQYDGRPSPVLEARLNHALDLYERGLAPLIVTTGSNQEGDRFTQGFTGFTYLREAGVPEADLRIVVDGTNTFEELSATAAVLRNGGVVQRCSSCRTPITRCERWRSPERSDSTPSSHRPTSTHRRGSSSRRPRG